MNILKLGILCALVPVFVACKAPPEQNLYGVWHHNWNSTRLKIAQDGTFQKTWHDLDGEELCREVGRWRKFDRNLRLDYEQRERNPKSLVSKEVPLPYTEDWIIMVNSDRVLTLKEEDGAQHEYRKQPSQKAEQDDAVQPATAVETKSEGDKKPKPESEGRSQ
jgi:hypothetical protein